MSIYTCLQSEVVFACVRVCVCVFVCVCDYRVAKTHRIPYLYRSFSAKVTYI